MAKEYHIAIWQGAHSGLVIRGVTTDMGNLSFTIPIIFLSKSTDIDHQSDIDLACVKQSCC